MAYAVEDDNGEDGLQYLTTHLFLPVIVVVAFLQVWISASYDKIRCLLNPFQFDFLLLAPQVLQQSSQSKGYPFHTVQHFCSKARKAIQPYHLNMKQYIQAYLPLCTQSFYLKHRKNCECCPGHYLIENTKII